MDMKKVLICAGGTGGHIFPAIALAEELRATRSDIDVHFIGGRLTTNRFFPKEKYPFCSIECSALPFSRPWLLPNAGWSIWKGFCQSQTFIKDYEPDLIVAFGSYFTFPTLLAARKERIPYVLHESNRIPGKVNRLMASRAITTALHFPDVAIKGNKNQVSMPLRADCNKQSVTREEAARYYGLSADRSTLLVLGGSQGAKAINALIDTAKLPFEQIIHLTGTTAQATAAGKVVKVFEPEMKYAYALADAVICRAGASTLSELIEFELPAVLIPYPQAADNHQEANARFFEQTVGGGVVVLEKDLNAATIIEALRQLKNRQANIQAYKKKQNLQPFEALITQLLDKHG